MGLQDALRFDVPMSFNTPLWRVVAMTPGSYVVAEYRASSRALGAL